MIASPLACSVRRCGLPLERRDRVLVCAAGHSHDVARSGYVNLLQPQDRRSPAAGDARAAIEARARLLEAGVGRRLIERLADLAASLPLLASADGRARTIVDLGSGSGDALAAAAARTSMAAIGIDLSTAAAEHAARRFPALTWIVANADRRLPLLDASVDVVVSVHARRNPDECARVLVPGGFLIVAVPAADDLIELRAAVHGAPVERDRVETVLTEHARHFTLQDRSAIRERRTLDRAQLLDALRGTYRGERDRKSVV